MWLVNTHNQRRFRGSVTKLKKLLFEAPEASVFNIETHLI
jgi:hypothetical protein